MKILDIAAKNLKSLWRDKKVMFIIVGFPLMFYLLLGLMFGGGAETSLQNIKIGYINADLDSDIIPLQSHQSISTIVESIQNASETEENMFKLFNYTKSTEMGKLNYTESIEIADAALYKEEINAYIVFEKGFQDSVNEKSTKRIGVFDNDSTVYSGGNPNSWAFRVNNLYTVLQNLNFNFTNLTQPEFTTAFQNISNTKYDYLLVFNEGFEENVEFGAVNVSLYGRSGVNETKHVVMAQTIKGVLDSTIYGSNPSNLTVITSNLEAPDKPNPKYFVVFLQSTSDIIKSIVMQTISAFIQNIINYNLNEIAIDYETKSNSVHVINSLTFSTPGYILYGAMNAISFAVTLICQEANDGTLKRLQSTRVKNVEIISGFMLSNIVVVLLQFMLSFAILSAFRFNPYTPNAVHYYIGVVISMVLFALFVNGLAVFFAPIFKSPEAAGGGVWVVILPLMMLSGVFFPIEFISPQFVEIMRYTPVRVAVVALQALMIDGFPITNIKIWGNWILLVLYTLILFVGGILNYPKLFQTGNKKKSKQEKP